MTAYCVTATPAYEKETIAGVTNSHDFLTQATAGETAIMRCATATLVAVASAIVIVSSTLVIVALTVAGVAKTLVSLTTGNPGVPHPERVSTSHGVAQSPSFRYVPIRSVC